MKKTLAFYNRTSVENFLSVFESDRFDHTELTFVLGNRVLSRVSEIDWAEMIELSQDLKKVDHSKVFLQWDVLMTESNFKGLCAQLVNHWDDFISHFDGIRVQDAGALTWLKDKNYPKEVHYICENGNHNLEGLLSWYQYWPQGITRLVLSAEFPAEKLLELYKQIPCELEVLAAGNILLFYTPRHLVSPLYEEEESVTPENQAIGEYRVSGTSEESPHKGFPIIDNNHGTFMFNTKELYIFTEEEKIAPLKNFTYRIDYPIEDLSRSEWKQLLSRDHEAFQKSRQMGQTKGFFRSNKTDVLFKKLKNHRLQDRGESYLGEVVDVKKKQHVAILLKGRERQIKKGDQIKLLSPEGREKSVILNHIWNAEREDMTMAQTGQIIFIPHVGGISVRTMVFKD